MKRIDLNAVTLNRDDIKKALTLPNSFGTGDTRFGRTWALGPIIETRDSDALARSNARVLKRELEARPEFEGQWEVTGCNHWAVGWVDHLSFVPVDDKGEPSGVFKFLTAWFKGLDDYPIADEDDFSQLEAEENES